MRAASYYAALALADGCDDAHEAVATAGAYVPRPSLGLAGESLQLHGGIGFTWEHDVHLFVRRARSPGRSTGTPAGTASRLLASVEDSVGRGAI